MNNVLEFGDRPRSLRFVFDFDGVLMESVDEVIVNTFNTVTGAAAETLEAVPKKFAVALRNHLHLAQPAGDFVLLGERIQSSPDSEISEEELAFLRVQNVATAQVRTERFFSTRAKFIARNRARWLELHRPFQPLWSSLVPFADTLLVVSNKNRQALELLFGHFGLAVLPDNLMTGDIGIKKPKHFAHLYARFPDSEFVFVDDSIHNLIELRGVFPELTLLLATWGNVGPDAAAQGRKHGITAVALDELVSRLDCEPDQLTGQ